MSKPSIPKGTRDFLPVAALRRKYIFNTCETHFKRYGYLPIETPAMENTSTLLGKYGEEGDRLIFKILNSGDFLSKVNANDLTSADSQKVSPQITEKALRYDLTVPFARFVVQNQNELTFPFKRYQIQPVWRADRPQKGRYREFFQCDIDVIGSDSLINEFELVRIATSVFADLGLNDVVIHINNRKILSGIAEILNASDKIIDLTVAIDKIDKIGLDAVNKELSEKGFSQEALEQLKPILLLGGPNSEKLATIRKTLESSEIGTKGVDELEWLIQKLDAVNTKNINVNIALARGLNYYTGAIFEVTHPDFPSSICGGGRYDDLTGIFGLKGLSGVGISFGADRIYDLLLQKDLYPKTVEQSTQVLFVNFGEQEFNYILPLAEQLRNSNLSVEIYPESAKMKKQMKYANDKNIPFVILAGAEEIQNNTVTLKNMVSGTQETIPASELLHHIH